MKAICASGPSPKAARQESVINRRAGLPRHHVAPCDKGGTAKRTSRHQKGGRTMTHHGLTRLAALLATGVATSCFMTVPAHAQETVYSFDIPAQDLGGALRAFGQATNQQIIFADDVVPGKRRGAVSGRRAEEHTYELRALMAIRY